MGGAGRVRPVSSTSGNRLLRPRPGAYPDQTESSDRDKLQLEKFGACPHRKAGSTFSGHALGARTMLAKAASDTRGRTGLTIDDGRVVALLTIAYGRPPAPFALEKIRRAAELWTDGENALAHIHLAHAGLPPCGEDETVRLFLAEECLAAGITPTELMEALGLDPAVAKYSPDQPRVPAGSGRESGRWTSGGGGSTSPSIFEPLEAPSGSRNKQTAQNIKCSEFITQNCIRNNYARVSERISRFERRPNHKGRTGRDSSCAKGEEALIR